MTKLRSRGALRREAAGEGADFVAAADVDDRAREDRVYSEAIDHGFDLAIVERAAIAREEIVDRGAIFEVAFAHSPPPWPGWSGPSRRPVGKSRAVSGMPACNLCDSVGSAGA